MRDLVTQYSEVAFVLLVTGAAMVYPPLALVVAGAFFVVLAVIQYRAQAAAQAPAEEAPE